MPGSKVAPLSPAAERALQRAATLAAAANAPYVEPVHILAAVLLEDESRGADLVTRFGGDPVAIARSLVPPTPDEASPPPELPPLSPAANTVLRLARSDQLVPRGFHAGTDHILAAVLRKNPELLEALRAAGVDVAELLNRVHGDDDLMAAEGPAIPAESDTDIEKEGQTRPDPRAPSPTSSEIGGRGQHLAPLAAAFRDASRLLELCSADPSLARMAPEAARILENLVVAGVPPVSDAEQSQLSPHLPAAQIAARLAGALHAFVAVLGESADPASISRIKDAARLADGLTEQLARVADRRSRLETARLYVLIGPDCTLGPVETAKAAVAGGAQVVQLRVKGRPDRELFELAVQLYTALHGSEALFIVNDRADVTVAVDADGVHVGQDELPVGAARRVVGHDRLVGLSTHTPTQAREAALLGADYIGVGPVFPSRTKSFERLAGLELVRQVCPSSLLPAFAIGGINADNVREVLEAGARRIAVSHAICAATDPEAEARRLRRIIDQYW